MAVPANLNAAPPSPCTCPTCTPCSLCQAGGWAGQSQHDADLDPGSQLTHLELIEGVCVGWGVGGPHSPGFNPHLQVT